MFCSNCGEFIEEGKAYCKHCGSPAPVGRSMPAPQAPPPHAVSSPPAAPAPPPLVPAAPEWQPPLAPGGRTSRPGLIAGIVAAVVIVLAGAGTGVYFGFFRDGGGPDVSTTTLAVSTTATTQPATTSTGAPTTGAVTTGAVTTQTIPSLTTSTSASSSTSTSSGGPSTTQDLLAAYLAAAEDLTSELERDDRRIPELAAEINDTAPAVPEWVRDELSVMLGGLDALNVELASLDVPAGFEDSYYWLEEAVMHMGNRIDATIRGIEAIWEAGRVNAAANGFFEKGRAERDAYRAAMEKYYEYLPVD